MRPHKFWVLLSLIPYPITRDNRLLSNSPSSFPLAVFAECSFFWEHSSSVQFSSVAQLCLTLLWPRGLQHTRLTCPSTFPGVFSNSCPLSQWCHPTMSSSVVPFSSCLQYFPASGSFAMSQLFASSGQSIGASASVFPMNSPGWCFRIAWFDLAVQGTLKSLL